MAGSFFHLWLARQAFAKIYGRPGDLLGEGSCWGAFAAGVLAPDIGFFPGGPEQFSNRVHHEKSGDFTRQLYRYADGDIEEAFAAGWALHIYTDSIIHPWVNKQVAALLLTRSHIAAHAPDLWHLRLEWGIDCFLLGQSDVSYLWASQLHFPQRSSGDSQLALVGRRFYADDCDEAALAKGIEAVIKWSARLPRIFLWTGHTRRWGCNGTAERIGRRLRPLALYTIGSFLENSAKWKNEASVACPWHPTEQKRLHALELGNKALSNFYLGYDEAFSSLPNIDLDSGELIP